VSDRRGYPSSGRDASTLAPPPTGPAPGARRSAIGEAINAAQAARIRIQNERDEVDAVDCDTRVAHYLRGAYETALEIENTLRQLATE
jgi:hypothetical protein